MGYSIRWCPRWHFKLRSIPFAKQETCIICNNLKGLLYPYSGYGKPSICSLRIMIVLRWSVPNLQRVK